jgi:PTH1 family peptidyl-tRNA hydrolase
LRAVFGIGNPGSSYSANRHNAGFLFLDYYASKKKLEFLPSKADYFKAEASIGESKYVLIKPTTYVNNSGNAANEVIETYNLQSDDFLVICDDINLNLDTLRVRLSGGDGGHNGLASIIYHLNSNNFPRIRIGVGQSFKNDGLAEYVLSDFNENEIEALKSLFEKAVLLVDEFLAGGSKAMLDLNSKLNLNEKDNTNIL